jgi:sporulation protein YlmC with PRC-barrel domain
MSGLRLVHDVLDGQLVDQRHQKIGRIDALMLELEGGRPPRVAAICIGAPERAHRVGRWMVWLSRAVHAMARAQGSGVTRVPFSAVRCIGDTVVVDLDGRDLEACRLESWLAEHVIGRIPGARRGKQ